jgi:hypothetical protein
MVELKCVHVGGVGLAAAADPAGLFPVPALSDGRLLTDRGVEAVVVVGEHVRQSLLNGVSLQRQLARRSGSRPPATRKRSAESAAVGSPAFRLTGAGDSRSPEVACSSAAGRVARRCGQAPPVPDARRTHAGEARARCGTDPHPAASSILARARARARARGGGLGCSRRDSDMRPPGGDIDCSGGLRRGRFLPVGRISASWGSW